MAKRERTLGIILVFAASMCWGTTGILQALAPSGTPPITVGAARVLVAGLILFPLGVYKSGLTFLRNIDLVALLIGVFGLLGYQFSFFTALKLTGVSLGSMIAIGTSPIFAGIIAMIVEKEPLSGRWMLSTGVAILGSILLILGESRGVFTFNLLGVMLALVAALCYSFLGLGLKMQGKRKDPVEASAITISAATPICLVVLLYFKSLWIFSPRGGIIAATLGIGTMAFPLCAFSLGLKKIYMRDAYTISLVEPLTATILSAVVLGERLTPLSLVGVGLIFLGILLLPASQGDDTAAGEHS